MKTSSTLTNLPRDLGGGLILRTATERDIEPLAEFDARIHGDDGPDQRVGAAVRNLLQGRLPTCGPQDFTIVEETRTGQIVSSLCLLSQIWSYGGITFPAGQPEFVGTDPAYRNRGLVRKQFDLVHEWARERGQMMLGITGIPYYYRLFGYEMAVDLDGWRAGFAVNVPALADGSLEPYQVRPATEADLPFIAQCYDYGRRGLLLSTLRSAAEWRFELLGKDEDHVEYRVMRIISTPDGEPLGFFSHLPYLDTGLLVCQMCELKPGVSWMAVAPTIIRALWQAGQEIEQRAQQKCTNFAFMLRENHPIYTVAEGQLPRRKDPYAWYLRVPDLKGFLNLIAPVLEQRLADSICVGHTGELALSFYHSLLCLRFEQGRLAAVEERQRDTDPSPGAAFTGLSFLQLLSGYRALAELEYAAQDTWARPPARVLLNILFPKQHSNMLPVL
jgi:predicted N-acetyltransferase YhbS